MRIKSKITSQNNLLLQDKKKKMENLIRKLLKAEMHIESDYLLDEQISNFTAKVLDTRDLVIKQVKSNSKNVGTQTDIDFLTYISQ